MNYLLLCQPYRVGQGSNSSPSRDNADNFEKKIIICLARYLFSIYISAGSKCRTSAWYNYTGVCTKLCVSHRQSSKQRPVMEENHDSTSDWTLPEPLVFDGMALPSFPPLLKDARKRFEDIKNLAFRKDDVILVTYPKSGKILLVHFHWSLSLQFFFTVYNTLISHRY